MVRLCRGGEADIVIAPDSTEAKRIDEALGEWRQGDVALGARDFLFLADPHQPLTEETAALGPSEPTSIFAEVHGLVVVTQTCDVVRGCTERPFVELCPLVSVSEEFIDEIVRGTRPRYAEVPALRVERLVADLDRVMTVEKSLVVGWKRTPGWSVDDQSRRFADALARKRSRPAFPDDFVQLSSDFSKRLQKKHDRDSSEGRVLRALREVRVVASPEWSSPIVELFFWFIKHDGAPSGIDWDHQVESWLELMKPAGRFSQVAGAAAALDDMTARDYVESDRLDLDHLTSRPRAC